MSQLSKLDFVVLMSLTSTWLISYDEAQENTDTLVLESQPVLTSIQIGT